MELLEPKEHTLKDLNGRTLRVTLSKFPATVGREIITQYPTSAAPKVGDYETNDALMLKLMSYVSVQRPDGEPIRLVNRALVDNHIPDAETLMRIEYAMLEYNTSFFKQGNLSGILDRVIQAFGKSIIETLKASKPS